VRSSLFLSPALAISVARVADSIVADDGVPVDRFPVLDATALRAATARTGMHRCAARMSHWKRLNSAMVPFPALAP